MSDWLSQIQKAKKSCIVENNMKKVHFDFGDGREMVEEYNTETKVLSRRVWRLDKEIKGEENWDIEIGDPEPNFDPEKNAFIRENSNQPFVSRRITKLNLEWRIRNLPYPIEVYSVVADKDNKCLVVKTSNKKYYKKLPVPDLERIGLVPEQENVSFSHKFNTLIITYKKPTELLNLEKAIWKEIEQVQPKNYGDAPNNCNPS